MEHFTLDVSSDWIAKFGAGTGLHVRCGRAVDVGLCLETPAPSGHCLVLQAATAQTANLFEIRLPCQTVVGGLDAQGKPFGTLAGIEVVVRTEYVYPEQCVMYVGPQEPPPTAPVRQPEPLQFQPLPEAWQYLNTPPPAGIVPNSKAEHGDDLRAEYDVADLKPVPQKRFRFAVAGEEVDILAGTIGVAKAEIRRRYGPNVTSLKLLAVESA